MTSAVNPSASAVDHGEADAVDRDRVAVPGTGHDGRARDREPHAVAEIGDRGDLAELLDDAGEHQMPPSVRRGRATTVQIGTAARPRRAMSSASAVGERPDTGAGQSRDAGPEQDRGQVGDDPVDEPGAHERAGQGGSALEQDVAAAPAVQGTTAGRPGRRARRGRCPARRRWPPRWVRTSSRTRAEAGVRPWVSTTTRSGCSPTSPPVGVPHRQGAGRRPARSRRPRRWCRPRHAAGARGRATPGRRDPPAGPVGRRDPAVEGRRDLPHDERPPQAHAGQPPLVGCLGLAGQQAADDLDTGSTQHGGAAGRGRARLRGRVHDPDDAGRQQRARAGAGPAGVRARLQRDDGRAAAGPVAGRGQREHLGVRPAGPLVPALADDHTRRVEHDGADVGVGVGGLAAGRGQRDGAAHRRRHAVLARLDQAVHRCSHETVGRAPGRRDTGVGRRRAPGAAARAGEAARTPQRRRRPACCLPSGLSPSVPEFHRVNRPGGSTWQVGRPDAGRGLSPPVRSCTDPGARVRRACLQAPVCHAKPGGDRAPGAVRDGRPHPARIHGCGTRGRSRMREEVAG